MKRALQKIRQWACVFLMAVCAVSANAQYYDEASGIFFEYYDETSVYVWGEGGTYSGDVVIPEYVLDPNDGETQLPVVAIGTEAFWGCDGLTSVEIPSTVREIWDRAFQECPDLTEITLPTSVTMIWDMAFSDCYILETIDIKCAEPEFISAWMVFGCGIFTESGMTTIRIPEGSTEKYLSACDDPEWFGTEEWSMDCNVTIEGFDNSSIVAKRNEELQALVDEIEAILPDFEDFLTAAKASEIEGLMLIAETELAAGAATESTISDMENLKAYLVVKELKDGEAYDNQRNTKYARITYTRSFGHTEWTSWIVPFAIKYDDISADFTVAYINDMHQFDDDDNGELDRTELEVVKLRAGDVVLGNKVYVIRPKAVGEYTFAVNDADLLRAGWDNSVSCSSTQMDYTFTGTYDGVSASEMQDNNYYAMSEGSLVASDGTSDLSPYRWYLKMQSRSGYLQAPKRISVVARGEGATGIEGVEAGVKAGAPMDVYDLNGCLVKRAATDLQGLPKGVYVVGGKKVLN